MPSENEKKAVQQRTIDDEPQKIKSGGEGYPADLNNTSEINKRGIAGLGPISLFKVSSIGLIATLFFASVLFNVSYLLGEDGSAAQQPVIYWVLIFGLVFLAIVSLIISFWSYHIRAVFLKDGPALVPERWGQILKELIDVWKAHNLQSQSSMSSMQKHTEEQTQKSNELMESFLSLQGALTVRDEEISRLKKGYDAKIFKRFLMRFVRVDRSLRDLRNEFKGDAHQKNYKYLSRLMMDALEECGVEQFNPEIGTDYRDVGPQVADDPIIIETEDPKKDFQIFEIESAGYVLVGEGQTEVVIPSRVSIYRFKSNTEEEK